MVPDHWSNDAMVSMDRRGLISRNYSGQPVSQSVSERQFRKNHNAALWSVDDSEKDQIWICVDKPARLIIRLLFGFVSDSRKKVKVLRRQCCLDL